jgi:hypothetical protein
MDNQLTTATMETQQSTDHNDDESIGKHKVAATSFTKINRPRQQGTTEQSAMKGDDGSQSRSSEPSS